MADCTDLHSAAVIINHLYYNYWFHYMDGAYDSEDALNPASFQTFTATSTSGSASMTSSTLNGNSYRGYHLAPFDWNGSAFVYAGTLYNDLTDVYVISGTATTMVLDVTCGTNGAAERVISTSKYHLDYTRNNGGAILPRDYQTRLWYEPSHLITPQNMDYTLSTADGMLIDALDFIGLLKGHFIDGLVVDTDPLYTYTYLTYYKNDPAVIMANGSTSAYRFGLHNVGLVSANNSTPLHWPINVTSTIPQTYYDTAPILASKLYTAVWRFPYTVGSIQFEDDSTPATFVTTDYFVSPKAALPSTS